MKQDKLDKAIADFEDESLDLSLGERITNMRSALSMKSFEIMKKVWAVDQMRGTTIEQEMKAARAVKEEQKKVNECFKLLRIMETLYRTEISQNKLLGKGNEAGVSSADFLKTIHGMKSSIGDIIAVIPKTEKTEDGVK